MECPLPLCWPLCSSGVCIDCPHLAASLQAAANSLDGIIDTVAVKHPLADYLNLLKVCLSPLHVQHLQALSHLPASHTAACRECMGNKNPSPLPLLSSPIAHWSAQQHPFPRMEMSAVGLHSASGSEMSEAASPLQEPKDFVQFDQSLPLQHLLAAFCQAAFSCHN